MTAKAHLMVTPHECSSSVLVHRLGIRSQPPACCRLPCGSLLAPMSASTAPQVISSVNVSLRWRGKEVGSSLCTPQNHITTGCGISKSQESLRSKKSHVGLQIPYPSIPHLFPVLLILRQLLRRLILLIRRRLIRRLAGMLSIPALRRLLSLILQRYLCSSCSSIHLLLYVRPVLDVLFELADVAGYGVPGFEAEGDERHEAEGEPFPVR